jgi:hypothetical protein
VGDDGISAGVNRAAGGAVEHWVSQLAIEVLHLSSPLRGYEPRNLAKVGVADSRSLVRSREDAGQGQCEPALFCARSRPECQGPVGVPNLGHDFVTRMDAQSGPTLNGALARPYL